MQAMALHNAIELEHQAHGVSKGRTPVVWDPCGKVRIYYPQPHLAHWDDERGKGPELFVARVAIPFLRDMLSAQVHLGSVPEIDHGSTGPNLTTEVQGAHVSIKRA